jgi:hypothetical protein
VRICAMLNSLVQSIQFLTRLRSSTVQYNCGSGSARPNTWAVPGSQVKPTDRPDTAHLTKAHRDPLNIGSIFN